MTSWRHESAPLRISILSKTTTAGPCAASDPYAPRIGLVQCPTRADLHLVSLKPECEGLTMPSKLYGILAVGRPVLFLGDPHGAVAHLLRETGAGLTLDSSKPEHFRSMVCGPLEDRSSLELMIDAGRSAFHRFNSVCSLTGFQEALAPTHGPLPATARAEQLAA